MMATKTPRLRLDMALVERSVADTRSRARAFIMAGDVLVNGQVALQAGDMVSAADDISLKTKPRFVSRGGEKLDHALDGFGIDVTGRVCVDLGASTGGFTDCLLQRGAAKVYAIDVGYGQLDERLRTDSRVVSMERQNARYVERLPENCSFACIDVSFISLSLILPTAAKLLEDGADCVPLVKPQFEAGKGEVGKGGVVRTAATRANVLKRVCGFAVDNRFGVEGLVRSTLRGPAGNIEYLAWLRKGVSSALTDLDAIIAELAEDPEEAAE